jgi:hypothetical protein
MGLIMDYWIIHGFFEYSWIMNKPMDYWIIGLLINQWIIGLLDY